MSPRPRPTLFLFALALLAPAAIGRAQIGGQFNKAVAASTTIVIARLDQYLPEPESLDRLVEQQLQASSVITGNPEAVVLGTIQPRGTYVFAVLSTIKGRPPQPLIVRLPRVSGIGIHDWFNDNKQRLSLKANYLLVLSGDEKSGFAPTTSLPIQLSPKVQGPKAPLNEAPPDAVFSAVALLFVDSLTDPATRAGAAHILAQAQGPEILRALRPFADDPDDTVRAAALACMALNQDLDAIPRIAAWRYSNPNMGGNPVNGALESYKTPAAIPALNHLICEAKDQYTRLNALQALRQLPPDKSSIPYLIQAMRDPENANTANSAYFALLKMIPELGPNRPSAMNRGPAESEIQRFETWWADEQAGKHK